MAARALIGIREPRAAKTSGRVSCRILKDREEIRCPLGVTSVEGVGDYAVRICRGAVEVGEERTAPTPWFHPSTGGTGAVVGPGRKSPPRLAYASAARGRAGSTSGGGTGSVDVTTAVGVGMNRAASG
ncbi:hypothetical protein [Streptomyces sp. NPDC088246]|uniref:hypothetical protein n=1 Tax=Streptomyces sp. NPDC088246 TaxID=3365842 RepID=UPI0037F52A48